MSIYSALGVPEVWRYDGTTLEIHCLQAGDYIVRQRSVALAILTAADIVKFLNLRTSVGENKSIKQFRQWIQNQTKD